MKTLKDAIELIMAEPPEPHYPAYYADLLKKADVPDKDDGKCSEIPNSSDTISRHAAIDAVMDEFKKIPTNAIRAKTRLLSLPSAGPDLRKYEYHYDHTDCIWYRPEARNRCPVTCAQYRDGWNDAMNYIFRDGKGYRPYRRGEQYDE